MDGRPRWSKNGVQLPLAERQGGNITSDEVDEVEVRQHDIPLATLTGVQDIVAVHTVNTRMVVMGSPNAEVQGAVIDMVREYVQDMSWKVMPFKTICSIFG